MSPVITKVSGRPPGSRVAHGRVERVREAVLEQPGELGVGDVARARPRSRPRRPGSRSGARPPAGAAWRARPARREGPPPVAERQRRGGQGGGAEQLAARGHMDHLAGRSVARLSSGSQSAGCRKLLAPVRSSGMRFRDGGRVHGAEGGGRAPERRPGVPADAGGGRARGGRARGARPSRWLFADNNAVQQIHQLFRHVHAPEGERPAAIVVETVTGEGLERVARNAVAAGIGWVLLNRQVPLRRGAAPGRPRARRSRTSPSTRTGSGTSRAASYGAAAEGRQRALRPGPARHLGRRRAPARPRGDA